MFENPCSALEAHKCSTPQNLEGDPAVVLLPPIAFSRSLSTTIFSTTMALQLYGIGQPEPWVADTAQLAMAMRILPQLTQTADALWRDFEEAGICNTSQPLTSMSSAPELRQKISVFVKHPTEGYVGDIILRSPRHDRTHYPSSRGDVHQRRERAVEHKDVTVAKVVLKNIDWGTVGWDITGILPLLLAFRNTSVKSMKRLELLNSEIHGEACLQALGAVLARKPICDLFLEGVTLPAEFGVAQLHDGWRALTRLVITRTPDGLKLLTTLGRSGSRLVKLFYQVQSSNDIWSGELRAVLFGFPALASTEIEVLWSLIDPRDRGRPPLHRECSST